MPDPAIRLDHVAITVQDMARSVDVCRDLVGFEVVGQPLLDDDTFKIVYLRSGGAHLELFAYRDVEAETPVGAPDTVGGFKHLALQTRDVDAVAARLEAAGVPFTVEPTDAAGGVRLASFRDPDGNLLELVSGVPDLAPYRPAWPRARPPARERGEGPR
jgi:catechol 2,3-dioxygenase-like lactoylglutathione lyase family enzyme